MRLKWGVTYAGSFAYWSVFTFVYKRLYQFMLHTTMSDAST